MSEDILYKETVRINHNIKRWIIASVTVVNVVLMALVYRRLFVVLPGETSFDKEGLVFVFYLVLLVSALIIWMIVRGHFTFIITPDALYLQSSFKKNRKISAENIKDYKKVSKKELVAMGFYDTQNKGELKSKDYTGYFFCLPNYIIWLHNGKKVLLRVRRTDAFEYAMDKILKRQA